MKIVDTKFYDIFKYPKLIVKMVGGLRVSNNLKRIEDNKPFIL